MSSLRHVVQLDVVEPELRGARAGGAARLARMRERLRQEAAGDRGGIVLELLDGAGGHHFAAAHAGAGPEIDDVIRAADGVFVVLDDHQRVAMFRELGQRVEQHAVVARMQADGGLVEHVTHALQVRAELRREPDALRLAARQRRRRAVRAADSRGPTRCRKAMRDLISAMRSRAISASRLLRRSFVDERDGVVDGACA